MRRGKRACEGVRREEDGRMLKIENYEIVGWEHAIRGMRNPKNSWEKSDSEYAVNLVEDEHGSTCAYIGSNDWKLMSTLRNAGTDHRKFMRMITVYVDITAPLYWWKEYDTYKVGTVANSCSTMHKIHDKEFTFGDFSHDYLIEEENGWIEDEKGYKWCCAPTCLETTVKTLNAYRYQYLKTKNKRYWYQMIQLLPSSYNQKRTVMLNYEVLANMYKSRKNHKLDEWHVLCDWIESLPYSELITGDRRTEE